MKLRIVLFALALAAPAAADPPLRPAQTAPIKERAFTRADYESYFAAGRFASRSVYYQSEGVMEVIANKISTVAGRYVLAQTIDALDVSPNYDVGSAYPFYKVRTRDTEQMFWDDKLNAYVFEYSNAEFDGDNSLAWESKDTKPEISKGDKGGFPLHKFYHDADRRAGHNVAAIDAQYRKDVTGMWTWRCFYLQRAQFDVECRAVHQPSGRSEDYSYRKLDLVS